MGSRSFTTDDGSERPLGGRSGDAGRPLPPTRFAHGYGACYTVGGPRTWRSVSQELTGNHKVEVLRACRKWTNCERR